MLAKPLWQDYAYAAFVGLARTIYIYGVYTVILAGESPNIRSYTVCIYGFGQPYAFGPGAARLAQNLPPGN
jgi:hypothetical protein